MTPVTALAELAT